MLLRLKIVTTFAIYLIILAKLFALVETIIVLICKIIVNKVFKIK